MTTARQILEHVIDILEAREANYDHPYDNFRRIADIDEVILGEELSTVDVALLNIGQKLGRLAWAKNEQGKDLTDHFYDIIGYIVCAMRCWEQEKEDLAVEQDSARRLKAEQDELLRLRADRKNTYRVIFKDGNLEFKQIDEPEEPEPKDPFKWKPFEWEPTPYESALRWPRYDWDWAMPRHTLKYNTAHEDWTAAGPKTDNPDPLTKHSAIDPNTHRVWAGISKFEPGAPKKTFADMLADLDKLMRGDKPEDKPDNGDTSSQAGALE
jgi:hypothetical protein